MSIETRIKSLKLQHKKLEEKLYDAYTHHLSTSQLKQIKKQKLSIKDEIRQLIENKMAA